MRKKCGELLTPPHCHLSTIQDQAPQVTAFTCLVRASIVAYNRMLNEGFGFVHFYKSFIARI